jgi:adenosylcobinamide kinase/adenosylcobinamide-phosphate guanylyltransferase
MEAPRLTLITGGARSGKSAHALALALAVPGARRYFVATAEPLDDEFRARIERHRADRPATFITIEEGIELSGIVAKLEGRADLVVIDCLTLWVANLLGRSLDDAAIMTAVDHLADALKHARFSSFVVTGEVGAGIVPVDPIARRFRDLLGWTNQKLARVSDRVILMTAGYPITVK